MPQNKPTQPIYGIKYLAIDAAWKYLKGREYLFTGKEILQLSEIVARPHAMSLRAEAFGRLWENQTHEVIGILHALSAELRRLQNTQSGIVREFLLTHATVNFKGKFQAVQDLDAGEIAAHLTRPNLNVTPASVTTERKKLNRTLRMIAYWQKPEVEEFMERGPKIKRIRKPKGGKK